MSSMAAMIGCTARTRFLCVRRFQNKIKESVYTLIAQRIEAFGIKGYDVRAADIKHSNGSEFVFYGIERNFDEIKSFEGADILWIEEAHNLSKEQWEVLRPTIRKEGSEIWVSFNPRFMTDFVYQRFIVNPPDNCIVRMINYDENPNLSQTALADIDELRRESQAEYEHIYLGVPKAESNDVIIKYAWVLAAVNADKKLFIEPSGQRRVGFDVADGGDDKNALVAAHGGHVTHIEEWEGEGDSILKSASKVHRLAVMLKAEIRYDSIGVGASCGAKFGELNETKQTEVQYQRFVASGKVLNPERFYSEHCEVKNKDYYANAKAQAWLDIADRLRKTYNAVTIGEHIEPHEVISISPECEHIEKLAAELSAPFRQYDALDKVKVESKKDMAKRGIKSPNLADAFIMALCDIDSGPLDILEFL
jgi:phage terminase large subunit